MTLCLKNAAVKLRKVKKEFEGRDRRNLQALKVKRMRHSYLLVSR